MKKKHKTAPNRESYGAEVEREREREKEGRYWANVTK